MSWSDIAKQAMDRCPKPQQSVKQLELKVTDLQEEVSGLQQEVAKLQQDMEELQNSTARMGANRALKHWAGSKIGRTAGISRSHFWVKPFVGPGGPRTESPRPPVDVG